MRVSSAVMEMMLEAQAADPQLDLDRLLWTPGERKIFLPPVKIAKPALPIDWREDPYWMQDVVIDRSQRLGSFARYLAECVPGRSQFIADPRCNCSSCREFRQREQREQERQAAERQRRRELIYSADPRFVPVLPPPRRWW